MSVLGDVEKQLKSFKDEVRTLEQRKGKLQSDLDKTQEEVNRTLNELEDLKKKKSAIKAAVEKAEESIAEKENQMLDRIKARESELDDQEKQYAKTIKALDKASEKHAATNGKVAELSGGLIETLSAFQEAVEIEVERATKALEKLTK